MCELRLGPARSAGPFRLEEAQRQAAAHVRKCGGSRHDEKTATAATVAAGRRTSGAAREKHERIERARAEMEDLQERYAKRSSGTPRSEPRSSTTDPQARRMKMADGGTRPALNVQFVSDGDAQLIVTVDVTSQGSDAGLAAPGVRRPLRALRRGSANYLVGWRLFQEGGRRARRAEGTASPCAALREDKQLAAGKDPYAARPGEGPGADSPSGADGDRGREGRLSAAAPRSRNSRTPTAAIVACFNSASADW